MPATATDRIDGLTTSVAVKAPCKVASTANITLSGPQTISGVAVVAGDRVLVTAQTNAVDNGIWVVQAGTWKRAKDFDGQRDVVQGTMVLVGPQDSARRFYGVITPNPIVIGTTEIEFDEFDPTEEQLRVDLADTTNPANGAALVANAAIRVDSVAALRALPAPSRKTVVYVEGYYTPNDGGGGAFLWVPASTNADNGGTVIRPDSLPVNGRWERGSGGAMPVEWFGARGDRTSNDTSAIQAALSALSSDGGGDLIFSQRKGYVADPFIVPAYCNIRGNVQGPFDGQGSPSSLAMAPTILVNSGGSPAVTLNGFKSSASDLLFFYTGQVAPTAAAPLVFPPTVEVPVGQGGGHFVERCTFVNSYDAVKIGVGRCGVRNCIIGAFHRDVQVDEALDWVLVDDNFFQVMWDVYAGLPFPQNIDAWVLSNGVALEAGRIDSLAGENFKVFGRYAGFSFQDSANTGLSVRNGYGRFVNVDFDFVAYGVLATSTNNSAGGYKIVNMDVGANSSGVGTAGQATMLLAAGGTSPPRITWMGGSVRGTWAAGSPTPSVAAGRAWIKDVVGLNDVGALSAPAFPASGVSLVNPFHIPVRIGIAVSGGSVSSITINGFGTGRSGASLWLTLEPGETIVVTYTGTPAWSWFAS